LSFRGSATITCRMCIEHQSTYSIRRMSDKNSRKKNKAISVIIPVLNEAERINSCIEYLYGDGSGVAFEVIVVDGDPEGNTINQIKDDAVIKIIAPRGRALQMNAGADIAVGEILLFLHADTRLPENGLGLIKSVMDNGEFVGGAFSLGIDSERFAFRIIEFGASLRYRFVRIPFGDQAIFIRRDYFNSIGRYSEIPIMEDAELMHRIKKLNGRIDILKERVQTSPRKWEEDGIIYATLRNYLMQFLFLIGVSPARLLKLYYR
jgi:rSAM/selenodomain-associated transferase 2